MFTGAYHPPWSGLLHPVTCEYTTGCNNLATHDRGGWSFCFDHWLVAVQWEQPRHEEAAALSSEELDLDAILSLRRVGLTRREHVDLLVAEVLRLRALLDARSPASRESVGE